MNYPKYIIFDNGVYEYAIIFANFIEHNSIALKIKDEAVGAGFFRIEDNHVVIFGESVSLGIKPRSVDASIVHKAIFGK